MSILQLIQTSLQVEEELGPKALKGAFIFSGNQVAHASQHLD